MTSSVSAHALPASSVSVHKLSASPRTRPWSLAA